MFKSNPSCAAAAGHHHRQHDINHSSLLSGPCQKPNSYASGAAEEKSPEPKPRWNPKPEQIRILESIFNSGMVNPPRDEIRRIRDQLQAYGQVGDANVFYWFQNRKSRSKLKLRHLKSSAAAVSAAAARSNTTISSAPPTSVTASSSSSSSSSDRSSSASDKTINPAAVSLAAFFDHSEFQAPIFSPDLLIQETSAFLPAISSGELAGGIEAGMPYLGMLALLGAFPPAASTASPTSANGMEVVAQKSTIFINEIAYEVTERPVNIREAFGENTVLIHSSGQPVLTDEWGLTLHPLPHGSSYYLVSHSP
ncbi:WUSCHEL-related homeobox 8 [Platanthera zijinensis]|uniref:WUSCHEL-related homeobox 8 n=1 Tax=Platanthera zijinensis TaxID=2320716 RepID=A0AAP0G5U7_9ASPA